MPVRPVGTDLPARHNYINQNSRIMDFLQSEPGTYLAIQNAPDLISKLKVRSVQNFGISYMISLLLTIASSFEAVKSTIRIE